MQYAGDTLQIVGGIVILTVLAFWAKRGWTLLALKTDQRKLAYVRMFTAILVAAAEQKTIGQDLARHERLEWVLEQLLEEFPFLNHDRADMIIHSEVYNLNQAKRELAEQQE